MKNKIIKKFILIILIILGLYNIIYVVEKTFYKTDIITIFSTKIYVTKEKSMLPNIRKNSLLFISNNMKKSELEINNIIAYYQDGNIRIRRIVGINNDNTYITKGDNNFYNDSKGVKKEEVLGIVVSSIPIAGLIFSIIQSKIITFFIIFFLILLYKRSIDLKKKSIKRRKKFVSDGGFFNGTNKRKVE